MKPDIKIMLKGREEPTLKHIGMSHKIFNGKHQPCIYCYGDPGKDRARWIKEHSYYYCNQCGPHSALDMAIDHLGYGFRGTADYLRQHVFGEVKLEIVKAPDIANNERRIKSIHAGLKRITPDDAAGRYLAKRGITHIPQANAYFHPAIQYWEDGKNLGEYPCLVSIIRTPENLLATLHITYLTEDGEKANVSAQKKIMPTILSMQGAAIRLYDVDDIMAISEGIETSMSYYQMEGIPSWSVTNAQNMAKFAPPETVKKIYILCDEDRSFTGAMAAYTCANRLAIKGLDVCVVRLQDRDEYYDYSDGSGFDYNDYLILKANSV